MLTASDVAHFAPPKARRWRAERRVPSLRDGVSAHAASPASNYFSRRVKGPQRVSVN